MKQREPATVEMWAEGVVTDPKEVTLANGDKIPGDVVVVVVVVAVVAVVPVVTKVVSGKPR